MNEKGITILAQQQPGIISFSNYEELKAHLVEEMALYRAESYRTEDLSAAKSDLKTLKTMKKQITDKKKELEEAYTAPYREVQAKLDELTALIDGPLKFIDHFVKDAETTAKMREIEAYAQKKASILGEFAPRILESPAFRNPKWENATFTAKKWMEEIDEKISRAASDIQTIQTSGGKHTAALMARYIETLSMEGAKTFLDALEQTQNAEVGQVEDEDITTGYKVLKVTATQGQMAALLDLLALMGIEVEELEDGMPKDMEELTDPDFDSFVAFDIETSGSYGAASGDDEAKITEIGAVRVINGIVTDTFDMLANPGRKIVPRIARITHITDEMVASAPPVDDVIRCFAEFCGDSILIGHNIKGSDLHYITKAAKKAGVVMKNRFLDTYILARRFKDAQGWEKLNLGYLAGQYGFSHKEAHRAWSDAEVNVDVYFELEKLCEGGARYGL